MSGLPEQAVDALVLNHITQAPGLVAQHGFVDDHPCGCRWNDMTDRWHLCKYHDGMNDGLAMAAAPAPTPGHCPTCGSDNPRWTVGDTPHGRMLLSAFHCPDAWHDGGGAT